MEQSERTRKIYRLTIIGAVVNLLLLIFKFVAGIVGHSSAMIADAVHSLSDFITDFIVLAFVGISSKPSDESHDFGHGKYETLATSIIGMALVAVAGGILWQGCTKVWAVCHGAVLPSPSMIAFWAAIASIVLKEGVYQMTIIGGRSLNSKALEANAWHHRSDALYSVGTALGIGGAIFLGNKWTILDPIAAIVVSFFIMRVALQLIKDSVGELLEVSIPKDTEDEIVKIATSVDGVRDVHHLQTRQIGNSYAINMHIHLDNQLTLFEAHNISTSVEQALKEKYGQETQVTIHVEPLLDPTE